MISQMKPIYLANKNVEAKGSMPIAVANNVTRKSLKFITLTNNLIDSAIVFLLVSMVDREWGSRKASLSLFEHVGFCDERFT